MLKKTYPSKKLTKLGKEIRLFWGLHVGWSRDHILPHISLLGWNFEKPLNEYKYKKPGHHQLKFYKILMIQIGCVGAGASFLHHLILMCLRLYILLFFHDNQPFSSVFYTKNDFLQWIRCHKRCTYEEKKSKIEKEISPKFLTAGVVVT